MKNLKFVATLFLMLAISGQSFAQLKSVREMKKQRKVQIKNIKEKAVRKARQEEKRLTKEEGWLVFPGALPMSKMLESSWIKQYEMKQNDDMSETNAYIYASGNGVAKSKTAAKMQAIELAKVELAGQLQSHVTALTTSNIGNIQISNVDAETKQEVIQSAKTITSATLTNIKPVIILYRTQIPKKELKRNGKQQLKAGIVEVQVMLFYDLYQADIQVRKEIKKNLKIKMDKNEDELNKILGLE